MKKLLITLLILNSCVQTSSAVMALKEADDNMIKNCEFLGTSEGVVSSSGALSNFDLQRAKRNAIEDVASKGATHFVVGQTESSNSLQIARFKAYKCN